VMDAEDLKVLNSEQQAAILNADSVFLNACPGSGKTRALTYKLAYELSKLGNDKRFVIAITYTHRAADEIAERIEDMGIDTSRLWIGTIHSFCLEWIIRPYRVYEPDLKNGFSILDGHDQETLLNDLSRSYRGISSWDCGYYFTGDDYYLSCQIPSKKDAVSNIVRQYINTIRQNRQLDYEHMLYYAYRVVSRNSLVAKILSSMFSIILVDEYQDTKKIQYSIISSIIKAGQGGTKTFVVGDPNQSIFASMGGYPIPVNDFRTMIGVPLDELSLSKNYRSNEKVINYFGNYSVHNSLIEAAGLNRTQAGLITFNDSVSVGGLTDEIVRLVKYSIETLGISPHEICIIAPQWAHLAHMTRQLVSRLPQYSFDGPGMVPFSRDIDNFWYKIARIALTTASPEMYARRLRWAREVLRDMDAYGIDTGALTPKLLLRLSNSIESEEQDGLEYLKVFFAQYFERLDIDYRLFETMHEQYDAFFKSSEGRIARLQNEGAGLSDIESFRKVFKSKTGITISTIHGVKGAEFETVIAYALLEGMVPHFAEANGRDAAMKLLYVIGSRAKTNLHLIAEQGRRHRGGDYAPTEVLLECEYSYDIFDSE